jgi:hypothetical protein
LLKQSALEEADEPEPEPKDRPTTVLKLSDGFGLTEAVVKVFEDTDWKGQWAATTGPGIVRMLACCEEILRQKKRSLSHQTSVLYLFT